MDIGSVTIFATMVLGIARTVLRNECFSFAYDLLVTYCSKSCEWNRINGLSPKGGNIFLSSTGSSLSIFILAAVKICSVLAEPTFDLVVVIFLKAITVESLYYHSSFSMLRSLYCLWLRLKASHPSYAGGPLFQCMTDHPSASIDSLGHYILTFSGLKC